MNIKKRIGNFLITVGIVLLVLFFLSDYTQQVNGWYLFFGVISFGIGVVIARQGRSKPEPTRRFRLVRRLFGGKKDDVDEGNDE